MAERKICTLLAGNAGKTTAYGTRLCKNDKEIYMVISVDLKYYYSPWKILLFFFPARGEWYNSL
jgi:hypothetical protein